MKAWGEQELWTGDGYLTVKSGSVMGDEGGVTAMRLLAEEDELHDDTERMPGVMDRRAEFCEESRKGAEDHLGREGAVLQLGMIVHNEDWLGLEECTVEVAGEITAGLMKAGCGAGEGTVSVAMYHGARLGELLHFRPPRKLSFPANKFTSSSTSTGELWAGSDEGLRIQTGGGNFNLCGKGL